MFEVKSKTKAFYFVDDAFACQDNDADFDGLILCENMKICTHLPIFFCTILVGVFSIIFSAPIECFNKAALVVYFTRSMKDWRHV